MKSRFDEMVWNGENTEEVVKFCCDWEYQLCPVYCVYAGDNSRYLCIEPADTMRGTCLYINEGQKAVRALSNAWPYSKIIIVE